MSAIFDAVKEKNFKEVKKLIESGVKINEKDGSSNTILYYAASFGSLEVVQFLVEHGADIESRNAKNETALYIASYYGFFDIVKYLVKHGADVNFENAGNGSPLHFAAASSALKMVKYLVEYGADIHCRNVENNTALHYAAYSGSLEVVKYLTECGADVNCKNNGNCTPLLFAAKRNSFQIVKYLVKQGADIHGSNAENNTALHFAAFYGSLPVVQYLTDCGADVNCKNSDDCSPLHFSAEQKSFDIVKYLIEQRGADKHCRNVENNTVLHYAAYSGSLEIVKYLTTSGADVNCKNNDDCSPLHFAAELKSLEMVKYLVERGADIHCSNVESNTALHYAAYVSYDSSNNHCRFDYAAEECKANSLKLVQYLIQEGANVDSKNNENKTALHYAVESKSLEIVKYLVECGADIHCTSIENNTVLHYAAYVNFHSRSNHCPFHYDIKGCEVHSLDLLKYLVERGVDVNLRNDENKTALHYAIEFRSLKIVKYLVERGADIHCKSAEDNTALHIAAYSGSLEIVKYLTERGADVNCKNKNDVSPLHYAAQARSLETIKYVVEHGANVNFKTKRSATALHFAVSTGSLEMVKYLVENGAKVATKQHRGEKTVLYWACRKGNESIVEFLLQHGAKEDVHVQDRFGRSCFGKVCFDGNTSLVRKFLKSGIDIRREAELLCRNEEIASMLRLELLKSTKHREKVEKLKALGDGDLIQVGPTLKRFCARKDFSLGKGAEGTHVYVGIMEDDSLVAVKRILHENCPGLAENENTILNLIKTEHSQFVVKYRGFLKQSPFMYIILDLCEESLEEHVKSKPIEYLRQYGPRMIKQIFSGLEFLHGHNILHRDLKPLNVLVDITGGMRLADFGLSRVLDDDQTTCYTFAKGTKNWMPPEVIEAGNVEDKGRYKKKSDVYVAGMIAFFILTKGKHPFGAQHARMTNILNGKPLELRSLKDLEAKEFISLLIRHNIDERPYAGEVVGHPFLNPVRFYEELFLPRILLVHDSD